MKTCNGCDCLYVATQQLSHYRVVCGHNQRGQEIGWFYEDEEVPTPDWCPKEAKKKKTCNGCEHLIKLLSKSIDKKYLYVCVGEAKYGIAKAILETDKEGKIRVPTPYWCPKEAKNVQ